MDTAKYAGVPDLYAAGQKGSSKLVANLFAPGRFF